MTHRTVNLVAHPDDDLLFMNPDILSDVQSGHETWVVYLTAGNLTRGPAGMDYADQRIQGLRAAYARAAKVAADWHYELLVLPSGREVPTNRLTGASVRLVWPFVNAAVGTDNGDLAAMWGNPAYVAQPIDGRPSYTRASFIAMLRELITRVDPTFLRGMDPNGNQCGDHIDHAFAGRFAAAANTDANGKILRRMDAYFGYAIRDWPANLGGYWVSEKSAVWSTYRAVDSAMAGDPTAWNNVMDRQYRRHMWLPGDTAPTDL